MKEFDESKDITPELIELFTGASSRYIYSQLSYYLMLIMTNEDNPNKGIKDMSTFLGLLSDSYFGQQANIINNPMEK